MKLTEVIQPSATAIFEHLKEDTTHNFSDNSLQQISESIINFDQEAVPMTIDELFKFLDNC